MERPATTSPQSVWGDSLDLLKSAAMRIINLECPLTTRGRPIPKSGPHLRASPLTANSLAYASIDVVTLANNHTMDYGSEGLDDTLHACRSRGIRTVGAGASLEAAREVLYTRVGDTEVAVVNLCENEWSAAQDGQPGANGMDVVEDYYCIRRAAQRANVVLVVVHGGHEGYHYPSPRMVRQYRFYVDAGATAVVGHHAHCVCGYEVYRTRPIFYGLGNLLFPSARESPEWYEGIFVVLEMTGTGGISWEVVPYEQCRSGSSGIRLCGADERVQFHERLRRLNAVIANPPQLEDCWQEFLQSRRPYYLTQMTIKHRVMQRVLSKLGVVERLMPLEFVRSIVDILRCEAHRDACIAVLECELKERSRRARSREHGEQRASSDTQRDRCL